MTPGYWSIPSPGTWWISTRTERRLCVEHVDDDKVYLHEAPDGPVEGVPLEIFKKYFKLDRPKKTVKKRQTK